jgi:tetratricopeptide (TPR) repeat protein
MNMRSKLILNLILILILISTTYCLSGEAKPLPRPSLRAGDAAYENRQVEESARSALESYRSQAAYSQDVNDLWRFAMAAQFVGMRYAGEAEKQKLFEEGRDAGRRSLELDPKCGPCHFWTAINMALYGDAVGPLKMLFSLKEIREHLEQTAELDPQYAFAGAYRIQGIIFQKLPGILGGDDDKAREAFEKAWQLSPNELNALFLARFLRDTAKEPKKAETVALNGLALPPSTPIESREAREELRDFIPISPEPLLSSLTQNHSLE